MSYLIDWTLRGAIALGTGLQPGTDVEQLLLTTPVALKLCELLEADRSFELSVPKVSGTGEVRFSRLRSDELLRPGHTNAGQSIIEPIGWPVNPSPGEPVVILDLMRSKLQGPLLRARLTAIDAYGQHEQWWFGAGCSVDRHHRMLRESNMDIAMAAFDANGRVQQIELLNPPVPTQLAAADGSVKVRVAMVDAGVNYLLPQIATRLARDESGRSLGYDFWDLNDRPFDAHPAQSPFYIQRHGTATASLLLKEAAFVELIPYRYPRPDMTRMRDVVQHAAANNVRLIGLPLGGGKKEEWETFDVVAREHPEILFVASAGNNGRNIDDEPVYPASLNIPNMIVVTSVNDFGQPAAGVNFGYDNVDYLVPAENQRVLHYQGEPGVVSGSSYAVPRFLAIAAKLLARDPSQTIDDLQRAIERRFADGLGVKYVNQGYISDPLAVVRPELTVLDERQWLLDTDLIGDTDYRALEVPMDALVLDEGWSDTRVDEALSSAANILSQCGLLMNEVRVQRVEVPDYLKDLSGNSSRTTMNGLRRSGQHRRITVVFARDTVMQDPYEGEAFGLGNTRNRPWLQDSVWLVSAIQDDALALAHELFHVLANSGAHVDNSLNLMSEKTSVKGVALFPGQCELARSHALSRNLAKE